MEYQVTNYGLCGECKYHWKDHKDGWVCSNSQSDYFADYTEYTDSCEEWEERE